MKLFSQSTLAMTLRVLESKIPPDILQVFWNTSTSTSIISHLKYQGLFEIWKKLHADIFPTVEEDSNKDEDALNLDCPDLLTFDDNGRPISLSSNGVQLMEALEKTLENEICVPILPESISQPQVNCTPELELAPPFKPVSPPVGTILVEEIPSNQSMVGLELIPESDLADEITIDVLVIVQECNSQISPGSERAVEQASSVDSVSVVHQPRRSLTPSCKENSRNGIRERSSSKPPSPQKKSAQQILNEYHVFPSKANKPQ